MNGAILSLHHMGVAVADLAQGIPFYEKAFGMELLAPPVEDPIQKVKVCFLALKGGDTFVELISPLNATSPIARFLEKGIGAYHLCYRVRGLDEVLQSVRSQGCIPIGEPVPAAAFGGRRIAWCCTPTKHLVEFVEAEEEPLRPGS